jgi:DNA polymerase III subunit alpha
LRSPKFIHLRVHSPYSLLEGAIRLPNIIEACKRQHMPAIAIADRNNLFGALEASEELSKIGVQAITAITLAVYEDVKDDAEPEAIIGHIALYAQNEPGYENLMALASLAHLREGGTAGPGVFFSDIEAHSEGLICLTGGVEGPVNRLLQMQKNASSKSLLSYIFSIFGDKLYVELQRYSEYEADEVEDHLVEFAYEIGIPLVATNQCFFLNEIDYRAHDALICIADGRYINEDERRSYTADHRLKSPEEMVTLFADLPEALENTIEIAKRCAFRPYGRDPILPAYPCEDENEELAAQARAGLDKRLKEVEPAATAQAYNERLDFELNVIKNMGFPGYFLIVADFIQWSKGQGIPVGPGRGSGAGSVVAWALTITDLDPLRFNLLFERFLNPERVSMPDFDIDFCQSRRDEVITYVQQKYGRDQVAQIITFGKLQARAVLRDVGRVLQVPYRLVDSLCKMVPNNPASPVTLQEAIDGEERLQEARNSEPIVEELITISLKLEGLYRHASTHAAGLVIGDRPLEKLVPLYRDPKSDMPVTQFNMKWVEKSGLVKFDFLGLKTLTVLEKAVDLLAEQNIHIVLETIPDGDAATYELLGAGDTVGVFQLESAGMRDVLRRLKPDSLEDIIALVALYRPGPMDNIPKYISCKKGEEEPDYMHESLKPILEETYGVMIYQEQVMQIAQILSGYSLGEADLLRRAMGKKIKAEMDAQKNRFIDGALDNGVTEKKASDVFDQVNSFAGYGFNKSHAAAYAWIAYQTAYIKANYPEAFYAASMSLDYERTDKLQSFKQDANNRNIRVLSPDVNKSNVQFSVLDGDIVYALSALRNVGSQAMAMLVKERQDNGPFKDPFDFARRTSPIGLNRRLLEYLIYAGALDSLEPDRARLFAGISMMLGEANTAEADRQSQQENLFGDTDIAESVQLPMAPAWPQIDRLMHEFRAIGYYLSGHPLDDYAKALKRVGVLNYAELESRTEKEVLVAGTLIKIDERKSKKGNPFAFLTLSDPKSQYEAIIFSDTLDEARPILEIGKSVVLTVQIDREDGQIRLVGRAVRNLDDVVENASAGLRVHVDTPAAMASLQQLLATSQGKSARGGQISLVIMGARQEYELRLPRPVSVTPKLSGAVKAIRGVVYVEDV